VRWFGWRTLAIFSLDGLLWRRLVAHDFPLLGGFFGLIFVDGFGGSFADLKGADTRLTNDPPLSVARVNLPDVASLINALPLIALLSPFVHALPLFDVGLAGVSADARFGRDSFSDSVTR